MQESTEERVRELVKNAVIDKVDNYEPETSHKPFYSAIFSSEDIFKASILQSMYTTFGMSIWEQMAEILAEGAGFEAETQYDFKENITNDTESEITRIHKQLKQNEIEAGRNNEIEKINDVVESKGTNSTHPEKRVDVYIRKPDNSEYFFDITTVKPNKKEFQTLKRKMLVWMALSKAQDSNSEPNPAIAIPYNPYHPEPYRRWTQENLYGEKQLLVGKKFWNFCAGEEVYDDLINIFEEVGDQVKDRIQHKMNENKKDYS